MRFVLNVLWLVLSGIWLSIGYVIAGVLLCLTIIGIPFGIAAFRIANYALWPFGRTIIRTESAGVASAIGNVLWFVLAGLWLAIAHALSGVALCVTIIGIPLGIANFKMIPVSLLPLGRTIVDNDDLRAAYTAGPYPRQPGQGTM
ncbi:YccF domain-containing protein [Nocardioides sp. CER19]|uniref:YccF domain-containing protein n=1 Tax=Nocardioides sp. CER19 TaxID=3038538 RepID=UPI002449D8A1|nr:YccF domain-containing protein [Nocardioides sp. CER19]MDH2416500.1 YccF domain-containing protein [Nocardioides sp. CER19]